MEIIWSIIISTCLQLSFITGIPMVKIPVHSIQTDLKQNIVIQCYFSEVEGHANIYWYYYNKAGKHEVVHVFLNGEDKDTIQSPNYRGRTQLIHQKSKKGDASLLLSGVRITDAGQYRCFVKDDSGPAYDEATLHVHAPYSDGLLQITQNGTSDLAACTFSGGYPQDEINWEYSDGRHMNQTHLTSHSQTTEGLMVLQSFLSLHLKADEEVCCFVGEKHRHLSKKVCKCLPGKKDDHEVLKRLHLGLILGFGILAIALLCWIFLRITGKGFSIHNIKMQPSFKESQHIRICIFCLPDRDAGTLKEKCSKLINVWSVSSSKSHNETLVLKESISISAIKKLKPRERNMKQSLSKYYSTNQKKPVKDIFIFVYSCDKNLSTEVTKTIEDFVSHLRKNKDSRLVVALMNNSPNNSNIKDLFDHPDCNVIARVRDTKTGKDMLEDRVKTLLCNCLTSARTEENRVDENKDTYSISLMAEELA
ncbi:programmed cell death 1 ligand 1-like [Protopterus annectens]|uniref:programmed cell death 1 ligand 1-like n=1 Tax=Protopterus annectens TaxID=7888 RepID=UPI001CF9F658|nr:programmed cell death 1 ligand 1-like [Protopterus annectens]